MAKCNRARDLQTSQKHSSFGAVKPEAAWNWRNVPLHQLFGWKQNGYPNSTDLGIHLFMFKEMGGWYSETTHPVDIPFTVRSRLLLCLRHLECRHGDFWAQHRKISICGPVTWGVVVVVSMLKTLGVYWNFRSQATVHRLCVFLLNLKKDNHKIIQQLFSWLTNFKDFTSPIELQGNNPRMIRSCVIFGWQDAKWRVEEVEQDDPSCRVNYANLRDFGGVPNFWNRRNIFAPAFGSSLCFSGHHIFSGPLWSSLREAGT